MKMLGSRVALAATISSLAIGAQAQLEEVVVTAQKRSQSIQDVPISITAFGGDYLEEAGIQTVYGVADITPNFQIQPSGSPTNNRINIRGLSSVGNSAVESSVGVYVDGVYYARPGSIIGLLTDIQSFEVLRGPQGTLFGRNTPMGALNITTRNPSQETEGRIEAGIGNYGMYQVGGMLNAPLSDRSAARIAFQYGDRDGYGESDFDGEEVGERDDLTARGKFLYEISDRTSVLIAADYSEVSVGGNAVEVVNDTVTPRFVGTVNALFGADPVTEDDLDWDLNQVHGDEVNDEQYGVSLDVTHEFANGLSLRSITAYRDWESVNSDINDLRLPADFFIHTTTYETESFSQEFQLTSPGGQTFDWLLGAFYYDEDYVITERRDTGSDFCGPVIGGLTLQGALAQGAPLDQAQQIAASTVAQCLSFPQEDAIRVDFDQQLESYAFFGQATYNLSETLSITGGLRWTSDEKQGNYISQVDNPYALVARLPEDASGMERDDSKATGMANISWQPAEDVMLFASYSTGYKSGGFNSQGVSVPLPREARIFGPENTDNYEFGVKSMLLDGRMTANATFYRTEIDDFQDRTLLDGLTLVTINAGELRQQGIEADINWLPTESLRLIIGAAYLDSEYTDFSNAPPLPGSDELQDLTGEPSNRSPEFQGSISADWTQPVGGGLELFLGGSVSYTDEQNLGSNSNGNPQSIQDAYTIVNARLGLRSGSGEWDVTLFGNNLADEGYCTAYIDQPFGGSIGAVDSQTNTSVQRCVVGLPQTYSLRASYRF